MKPYAALRVLIACCCVAACRELGRARASGLDVDPSVPRLQISEDVGVVLTSAADFAAIGRDLYVLDWHERRVVQLKRSRAAWHVTRRFGRKGNGPGELMEPVAIEYDAAAKLLVVLERSGELEAFDTAGAFVRTMTLDLPCASTRSQLSLVNGLRLVAQRCFGERFRDLSADTAYMLLATVESGRPPRLLAAQPTATARGDWGSIFTASWPLGVSDDSLLFGSGIDECLERAAVRDLAHISVQCAARFRRYSAPEPRGFGRGRLPTVAAQWPDPLPLFTALLFIANEPVLVRPVSADSVAFEPANRPQDYFLVAPLNGLVGCKRAGCLWYQEHESGGRLKYVEPSALVAYLSGQRPG